MSTLERRLSLLAAFNTVALLLLIPLTLAGFTRQDQARFTEIDAERLNIVGPGGVPVLVLANRERIPGPVIDGREYPRAVADGRDLLSGMIFYNEQGDEVGGLIYNGIVRDSGYSAVGHLSLDQWKQNQVVALQYIDNGRTRRAGLRVWDRPTDVPMSTHFDRAALFLDADSATRDSLRRAGVEARQRGEFGVQRLFVGSQNRTAQVQLRDVDGRVRARLFVDSTDVARLEFLDAEGAVVAAYPASAP
jgi:hypothetical protein